MIPRNSQFYPKSFTRSFTVSSKVGVSLTKAISGARDFFYVDMHERNMAAIIGSTEEWDIINVLAPEGRPRRKKNGARKCWMMRCRKRAVDFRQSSFFAGDQFIITPAGRAEEAARASRRGDEVRTVIAGYHWFTDWGRRYHDLTGRLALVSGRCLEAGYILRTFAHYVRDGLIPNMFPDGEKEGLYHTADRDAVVFFTRLSVPALHRRSDYSASVAAVLIEYRGASFARHTFQYSRRPGRRSASAR
jgi:hypothetical protein